MAEEDEFWTEIVAWPDGAQGAVVARPFRVDADGARWEYVGRDDLRVLPEGMVGGVVYIYRRVRSKE